MERDGDCELRGQLDAEYSQGKALARFSFPGFSWSGRVAALFLLLYLLALGLSLSLLPFFLAGATVAILTGLGIFCAGVGRLHRRTHKAGASLCLYPSGVVLVRGNGRAEQIPWDEIEVRQAACAAGGDTHAQQRYIISREGGARVCELPASLPWAEDVGAKLRRHSTRYLIRRWLRQTAQGAEAGFGDILVGQAGLSDGKRILRWSMLEGWTQDQRWLLIWRKGQRRPWASVPLAQIPNLTTFYYLCEHFRAREEQPFAATPLDRMEAALCG